MKVVIFCGGMSIRMGEATQRIPKPMITIGNRPMLWHIMKWYASWGHKEFVLCLGYRAEVVKEYFLAYNEHWFDDELFRGLLRLRGMESATRYAEAFTCRKLRLVLT